MAISDSPAHDASDLTVEHVERAAAFNKRVDANVAKFRDGAKQLARCANRGIYHYDDNDIATILEELRRCTDEVAEAFRKATDAPARNAPWELSIAKRQRQTRVADAR